MAIKGADGLMKKLDAVANSAFAADLMMGMNDCIGMVQAAARKYCPENHGELRESIHTMTERRGDKIIATCYTDAKHNVYVEFGTGPVGQANHAGVAPDIPVAYRQSGWMIPGKAMDRRDAEAYGLGVIEDKNGDPIGYLTNGQAAQPYMYPALKDCEDAIVEKLGESVKLSFGKRGL